MVAISQQPTDPNSTDQGLIGLLRPQQLELTLEVQSHQEPPHPQASPWPERITARDAPSRSACKKERQAKNRAAMEWGQVTSPKRTLKGHALPMARLSHKSPERKGLRRSRPRGHPKQGATQRARAADSHHARWSTQGHKALTKHKVSSKASA
jgi:hypothetical protein